MDRGPLTAGCRLPFAVSFILRGVLKYIGDSLDKKRVSYSGRDMQSPIDVVYVIGQLSVGGTERQLLLLVKSLNRARFRPAVICLSEQAQLADSLRELDCPTFVLHRPAAGHLKTLLQASRLMRQVRPKIVHSFAFAGRAGLVASRLSGSPLNILSIRTNPYWKSPLDKWVDRYVISSADIVLANSHQALSTLRSEALIPRTAPRVIYNGLDLQTFDHLLTESPAGSLNGGGVPGLGQSGPVVCAVGSLRPVKEFETLLEAFAIVSALVPEARLWLVGDGPSRKSLEDLARRLRVDGRIVFWGLRSDVPALLQKATIGVNSSRIEGLCNAIIEYMAARLPVVTTNVGGNPELVMPGETGFLVPPRDPQAMAEALLHLLRDSDMARRLGEAGRRRVEEHFTVRRMVGATEAIYEELLSRNGR